MTKNFKKREEKCLFIISIFIISIKKNQYNLLLKIKKKVLDFITSQDSRTFFQVESTCSDTDK